MVDSAGALKDRHWYYAFGQTRNERTSTNQAYKYTSKTLDREAGLNLYYYGARYYDPDIGRFLSLDPLASKNPSVSPYAYVNNNPLRRIDPDGRTLWDIVDVGFAIWSIADAIKEPTAKNIGLAVVDVAAILPLVPSTGWFRRGADAAGGAGRALEAADNAVDAAKAGGKAIDASKQAFESFDAFKKAMGSAGEGMEWHHIVEQSKVDQFGAAAIHSTSNIVAVPAAVNRRVNAYYSSVQDFTKGKTVREWLKGKSFEEQAKFGQEVLDREMKQATN